MYIGMAIGGSAFIAIHKGDFFQFQFNLSSNDIKMENTCEKLTAGKKNHMRYEIQVNIRLSIFFFFTFFGKSDTH